jgi:hypothetical protein
MDRGSLVCAWWITDTNFIKYYEGNVYNVRGVSQTARFLPFSVVRTKHLAYMHFEAKSFPSFL